MLTRERLDKILAVAIHITGVVGLLIAAYSITSKNSPILTLGILFITVVTIVAIAICGFFNYNRTDKWSN